MEHLVQWRRLPIEESTWEDATVLQQQFPHLDLGDKVPLPGGVLINLHLHLYFHHCEDHSDVVRGTPDMMINRELHASRRGGKLRGAMPRDSGQHLSHGGRFIASVSDSLAFRKFVKLWLIYRLIAKRAEEEVFTHKTLYLYLWFSFHPKKAINYQRYFCHERNQSWKIYHWYQSQGSGLIIMTTNKERVENLEAGLGGLQEGVHRMEMGMADKLGQLETSINRLSEVLLSTMTSANYDLHEPDPYPRPARENQEAPRLVVSSKTAKLEFPRFEGGDPTGWFARVDQFFEFQATSETQKVMLASFHLEGEANQWWRWMSRTFREENRAVTWAVFEEELWARFGPTDGEDFDEALSRIRQDKSLREYQQEFEKLGNGVQGWTHQKALVGTFTGGLKPEIAEGIRMFKPRTLKEAINLARMKDERMVRQRRFTRPTQFNRQSTNVPINTSTKPAFPVKRLSWEEMRRRRAMGLCFNCDDKFAAGHKWRGPQLLLLEAAGDTDTLGCEDMTEEKPEECVSVEEPEPQISLYALTGWSSPKHNEGDSQG